MRTKKRHTAPPEAVYRAGKRKEILTKAIRYLKMVKGDAEESRDPFVLALASSLPTIIEDLQDYRKMLDNGK